MSKKDREGSPNDDLEHNLFDRKDLYLAYKRAKSDVYHENYQPKVIELAYYEQSLEENIDALFAMLCSGSWTSLVDKTRSVPVPKPIILSRGQGEESDTYTNDGFAEWANNQSARSETLGFKHVVDAPIELHIVSALWIELIGRRYDLCLSRNVYGSRTPRRTKARERDSWREGSLGYYPEAYQKWRKRGLDKIRESKEKGYDTIAITLDFSDFFGSIDPSFITEKNILDTLETRQPRHFPLGQDELAFTRDLVNVLQRGTDGLSIGIAASAVIANMALLEFDLQLESTLNPLYYGRYMDDLFIVLGNPGRRMRNADHAISHIKGTFNSQREGLRLHQKGGSLLLTHQQRSHNNTKLKFNKSKRRCFVIDANAGDDLLDTMESALAEISSERRLLPERSMISGASARALAFSVEGGDESNLLTRPGHLTIRRLGLSVILRSLRIFSSTFTPNEWKIEREWLVRLVMDHVLPPHRLFELARYVPRIVALMVSSRDWGAAHQIAVTFRRSLWFLVRERYASKSAIGHKITQYYDFMVKWILEDAISACPHRWSKGGAHTDHGSREGLIQLVHILVGKTALESDNTDSFPAFAREILESTDSLDEFISLLCWSDLHYIRSASNASELVRQARAQGSAYSTKSGYEAISAMIWGYRDGAEVLAESVGAEIRDFVPPRFLLFPTRRITVVELCQLAPEVVADRSRWSKLVRFARGTRERHNAVDSEPCRDQSVRILGGQEPPDAKIIAVANVMTTDADWLRSVTDEPNDGRARYERLAQMINIMIRSRPLPDYVVFPELSIPRRFSMLFGQTLLSSGVSSVMGVEYLVERGSSEKEEKGLIVHNEVHLYLSDGQRGYSRGIFQMEEKGSAAIHEQEELRKAYNGRLSIRQGREIPIYYHGGLAFAVLVCSELTNITYRAKLLGGIDVLFVPSWNRDLTTFSSLIESSATDLHCFVVVANNRMYGDSRIRGPYLDSWKRDVVRLHGGLHDGFAAGRIAVKDLRAFQGNHVSPSMPYKPVPDGFVVKEWRRVPPWKGMKKGD